MAIQLTPTTDKVSEIYTSITLNGRTIGDMTERTTAPPINRFHACLRSKTPALAVDGVGLVQGFGPTAEEAIASAIRKRIAACRLQVQELRSLATEMGSEAVDPIGDAIAEALRAAVGSVQKYTECERETAGYEAIRCVIHALGLGDLL